MAKKTILITGGAGFIGSHLCQKLTETKDNRVICVDNLITGSKSKIVFKPLPGDDPTRRCPDISRARRLLGWKPKVELREGLEETIDYFRHKNELNTQGVIPITP